MITLLLVVLVHSFVLTQVGVSKKSECYPLQAGDHVFVLRKSFSTPQRGDIIAFSHPQTGETCLAIIEALSGDSLWTDSVRQQVLTQRRSLSDGGLVLPASRKPVEVDSANVSLLAYLRQLESTPADSAETLILGHSIRLSDDYFWTTTYGPVGRRHLIGVCHGTSFSSRDGHIQWNRCFRTITTLKRFAALQ
ncbi:MAG: hypothetical protein IJ816_03330 [Alloprevotella sp.]|nr:hypothetical protein [Alloprevotella sp.]